MISNEKLEWPGPKLADHRVNFSEAPSAKRARAEPHS